CARQDSNLDHW
nr:immunoglobulin heavy chain junction region [Macaca mulatta]MOV49198.1 immunoglobulin heavy chain junction region [Macaca mulatta]MOV49264.1 immunoglobulin heavy chain junction region [Macaca mulatta]MOV49326.1 immunoglobulin heavy chain junction region [Macaca mulatta]MOV50256.1 immunoglobulin heavy chain junction region [Macaca mulatta]